MPATLPRTRSANTAQPLPFVLFGLGIGLVSGMLPLIF